MTSVPQVRGVIRIPIDKGFGLRGDTSSINMARYVAVAPRNVSTGLRYLDFGV